MTSYLRKPYVLEGWRNRPRCLRNPLTGAIRPLTHREFETVQCLDDPGAATFDPAAFARLALQGFITEDAAQAAPATYHYHDYLQRNVVQLSVTDRCNFRCRHCMATQGDFSRRGELTFDEISDLFAQMRELAMPYIELTGGEPLMRRDFGRIVQAANDAGLRIRRIYTNGALLKPQLLEQLRAMGQSPIFVISFDGLGVHDWMRGVPGAEQATLDAMDLVRSFGFSLTASMNVNARTAPVLEETCRHLVFERGADTLHLMRTAPSPAWDATLAELRAAEGSSTACGSQNPPADPFGYPAYFEAMLSLLKTAREENWPAMLDILHMPSLHYGLAPHDLERIARPAAVTGREKTMASCQKACNIVFVASDGRVLPCSAYEGASLAWNVMCGPDTNVRTARLRSILSDSAYSRRYEETVADMLRVDGTCEGCRWLSLCRGGCPLSRLSDAHQPSLAQNCLLFRGGYFERYLEVIGVNMDEYRDGVDASEQGKPSPCASARDRGEEEA